MALDPPLATSIRELAQRAKQAGRVLARASGERKQAALRMLARRLRESERELLRANQSDVDAARASGLSGVMLERLSLDAVRIEGLALAVEAIARLPDPVGRIDRLNTRPNGLQVGRMSVPLGLIAIVYESRPNVTIDAAALCLASGNACLLRGGSESFGSNRALVGLVREALSEAGLPADAVGFVETTERAALETILGLSGVVDLLIPRGGEGLIRYVTEHARVPVIQHYKGVCHVYIDGSADLQMAHSIVLNAKVQRPSVCNAMETLLVDSACAEAFLPAVVESLGEHRVELRGDERARKIASSIGAASAEDWDTEYTDLVLSIAVVDGIDAAIEHVARHGSQHTEAIVTNDYARAQRWLREVDASMVLVNASTRFNDGGELGLGAEMGISTTKLHAYGAMGLEELCTRKWIAYGNGQIRH